MLNYFVIFFVDVFSFDAVGRATTKHMSHVFSVHLLFLNKVGVSENAACAVITFMQQ